MGKENPQNSDRGEGQDSLHPSKQQRRHTYGSALSSLGKENSDQKDTENQDDASNLSNKQSFRNSINFDQNTNGDTAGQSFTEGERDRNELHMGNGTEGKRSVSPNKR